MTDENNFCSYFICNRIMGHPHETNGLTVECATKLGLALGTYFTTSAVFIGGRDFRRDARALKRVLTGGLMATGVDFIDLHAIPTNVIQFFIRRFGADGGIMVTRAHNLAGMVIIKIFDSTGIELAGEVTKKILEIAESGKFNRVKNPQMGWVEVAEGSLDIYKKALLSLFAKEKKLIQDARARVVVDCANGPVSLILPDILSDFGCDVITLNSHRPRTPDLYPSPESLLRLSEVVTATSSEIGIAVDVEGRHALFVDSQGRIRTPEETAAIIFRTHIDPNPHSSLVTGEAVNPNVYSGINNNIILSTSNEPGDVSRSVFKFRANYGIDDTGLFTLSIFSPGADALVLAFTILTQVIKEKIRVDALYQKYATYYRQRIETVPINHNKMMPFFEYVMNNPPTDFTVIDTYCGIKLFNRRSKSWIHYYVATKTPYLDIELYTPTNNADILNDLSKLARKFVEAFLNLGKS